jgi:hypothetical protein
MRGMHEVCNRMLIFPHVVTLITVFQGRSAYSALAFRSCSDFLATAEAFSLET